MIRTLLATTALSAVLATGAVAQTPPAAGSEDESEVILRQPAEEAEVEDTASPADDGDADAEAAIADDPADAPDEPLTADEGPTDGEPALADAPAGGPALEADDTAVTADPALDEEAPDLAAEPEDPTASPGLAEDDADAATTDEALLADDPAPEAPALDLAGAQPDDLVGSEVLGLEDDQIATVEDVISGPGGEVEAILVRFGGFLGFGQTTVALLPEEVEVEREAEGDALVLRTALTSDELRQRPAHDE